MIAHALHRMIEFGRRFAGRTKQEGPGPAKGVSGRGILVFHHTSDVIRAESLLRDAGMEIAVKGPPPELRTGCDLVIEFPLISQLEAAGILEEAKIRPLGASPGHLLEPSTFSTAGTSEIISWCGRETEITVDKGICMSTSREAVRMSHTLPSTWWGKESGTAPPDPGHTLSGYACSWPTRSCFVNAVDHHRPTPGGF